MHIEGHINWTNSTADFLTTGTLTAGAATVDSLTLDTGGIDYLITSRATASLAFQGQLTGNSSEYEFYTYDGDSTDSIVLRLFAMGTPASITNSESLNFGFYPALGAITNSWIMWGNESGDGVDRPLRMEFDGSDDLDQLVLLTDGSITMSGALGVTGTVSGATGSTFGNLTLADGSITDSSNKIDFGNEALHTSGAIAVKSGSTAPGTLRGVLVGGDLAAPINVDAAGFRALSSEVFGLSTANNAALYGYYSGLIPIADGNQYSFAKVIGMYGYANMVEHASYLNGATVVEAIGVKAELVGTLTPDVTTAYGVKVEPVTLGDTNYAIYTGFGLVRFGDKVGIGTSTPTTALQMGDDKLVAFDTNAGITASTTQTQGNGALTAQINEISTVANNKDTVTLPSAITGIEIEIINNGVNTLQIFPASGDDLGLGVNVVEELQANERVKFVAYDTTNWAKESTTEIIHAEIHDEDNTDAFVINADDDFHSYHTNGLAAGDLADWAFDAGGAGTSHAIASIADGADSGVDIAVTTADNHLLEDGDIISQTNLATAAYVGIFVVKDIISPTVYEVAAVFDDDVTGTMDQAATLEADAVAAGVYDFAYYISGTLVGNNETFDFQLYKEATAVTGSKIRRKFGAANDFGSMSGGGVVAVADGEKISFALSNEDSAANIILRNLTIVLVRL